MKIFVTLLLIFFSFFIKAQRPAPGSMNYKPELDKFEGIWKWNSGNNEVTLKLKKVMFYINIPEGFSEEVLLACHKYVNNGIVIEDNLSLYPSLGQNQTGSATLFFDNQHPAEIIWGIFTNGTLNKSEKIKLTYNSATQMPTLTWDLSNREKTYKIGIDPIPDDNTTLPKDLILTKQ